MRGRRGNCERVRGERGEQKRARSETRLQAGRRAEPQGGEGGQAAGQRRRRGRSWRRGRGVHARKPKPARNDAEPQRRQRRGARGRRAVCAAESREAEQAVCRVHSRGSAAQVGPGKGDEVLQARKAVAVGCLRLRLQRRQRLCLRRAAGPGTSRVAQAAEANERRGHGR